MLDKKKHQIWFVAIRNVGGRSMATIMYSGGGELPPPLLYVADSGAEIGFRYIFVGAQIRGRLVVLRVGSVQFPLRFLTCVRWWRNRVTKRERGKHDILSLLFSCFPFRAVVSWLGKFAKKTFFCFIPSFSTAVVSGCECGILGQGREMQIFIAGLSLLSLFTATGSFCIYKKCLFPTKNIVYTPSRAELCAKYIIWCTNILVQCLVYAKDRQTPIGIIFFCQCILTSQP